MQASRKISLRCNPYNLVDVILATTGQLLVPRILCSICMVNEILWKCDIALIHYQKICTCIADFSPRRCMHMQVSLDTHAASMKGERDVSSFGVEQLRGVGLRVRGIAKWCLPGDPRQDSTRTVPITSIVCCTILVIPLCANECKFRRYIINGALSLEDRLPSQTTYMLYLCRYYNLSIHLFALRHLNSV